MRSSFVGILLEKMFAPTFFCCSLGCCYWF